MSELCSFLEWDSTFFGRRIARVNIHRLREEQADQVVAWCAAERIECLYFLADSDDAETIRAVEARSFGLVDIRLTLNHRGSVPAAIERPRSSHIGEIEAIKRLARTNHRDTRFYYDGHFSVEEADRLYEAWIEQSCNGYADAVLVVEREGQPTGYITCDLHEGYGQIGLLGVGEAWQGQGIGTVLINGALYWFSEHGIERVQVVTQGRNVRAQRVYQRAGFVSANVQLWYHRWFTQTDLT